MTIALILWILFIGFEVWWNLFIIRKIHTVDHAAQLFIRVVVGAVLWIMTAIFADIEVDQWLAQPLALAFSFWIIFDSSLGWFLHKNILFVGTTSRLDKMQAGAPIVFWFFKFLLMCAGIALYYYGFGKVLEF